jgi:hypothetical protein
VTEPRHVLVVANETLTGDELLQAVKRRAAEGAVRVHVIAPVNEPAAGYVVYENSRRAAAGRRLERALSQLQSAGIPALGDVVDENPLDAVKDTLAQEPVDEVIVSTHPETKSGWLRRNLVDEIRRVAGQRPVEHVVAGDRVGPANVLVVANETVIGRPLLERVRARAAEEPVSFLIVCPQSDPSGAHHPEAERRLRQALAELRADGIEAHGQIAHPDPYTAAMQAVHDEAVDEIIVSTFPGDRGSSWLRRDVVGRLRNDAKVPVEHVVVDPAELEVTL